MWIRFPLEWPIYPYIYQIKWYDKLRTVIMWEEVWNTVHNFLLSNKTKTIIWEQLHLNFYTQYSYNKWHKVHNICPLCRKVPESIYHIILNCEFVNNVWRHMQPLLSSLHRLTITDEEKALGIVTIKKTTGILLRNWLTFKVREQVMLFERKKRPLLFKAKFNQSVALEIKQLMIRFNNEHKLDLFDKIIAYQGILCEKIQEGEYQFKVLLNWTQKLV